MTDHRELVGALRRAGASGVDDSALARAMYSSDASLYRVPPRVVVTPRDAGELPAVLGVCREAGVPLTMRG
ncbi:FAD-binding oxidoreductase, partial [Actinomadura sp. 6K520]|uniref:FAD-binding oxidoreductase n=1 Tax=Actinomadura sp. 6K520 TaxID=2530364 RepID=UPI001050307E